MKYIHFMTFVTLVIVLGWIFRPVEEHMTNGTCKRPMYGPQAVDVEKCARVYPEVYGPSGSGLHKAPGSIKDSVTGEIRDIRTGEIRDIRTGEIRDIRTGEIRDIRTGEIRDIRTGEIRDIRTGEIRDSTIPTSTNAMYEDDGEFRSDTATRNAAYMNVFTFQPYAKMDFPVSGPPQPYLSDFANFHK